MIQEPIRGLAKSLPGVRPAPPTVLLKPCRFGEDLAHLGWRAFRCDQGKQIVFATATVFLCRGPMTGVTALKKRLARAQPDADRRAEAKALLNSRQLHPSGDEGVIPIVALRARGELDSFQSDDFRRRAPEHIGRFGSFPVPAGSEHGFCHASRGFEGDLQRD